MPNGLQAFNAMRNNGITQAQDCIKELIRDSLGAQTVDQVVSRLAILDAHVQLYRRAHGGAAGFVIELKTLGVLVWCKAMRTTNDDLLAPFWGLDGHLSDPASYLTTAQLWLQLRDRILQSQLEGSAFKDLHAGL